MFNWLEAGRLERVAASEWEVWQGHNRKGAVEAEEDLNFEVADKATVGGNGSGKLVLFFERDFPSKGFFANDRARTIDDCQVLLLHFNKMMRELVRYGDYHKG